MDPDRTPLVTLATLAATLAGNLLSGYEAADNATKQTILQRAGSLTSIASLAGRAYADLGPEPTPAPDPNPVA